MRFWIFSSAVRRDQSSSPPWRRRGESREAGREGPGQHDLEPQRGDTESGSQQVISGWRSKPSAVVLKRRSSTNRSHVPLCRPAGAGLLWDAYPPFRLAGRFASRVG